MITRTLNIFKPSKPKICGVAAPSANDDDYVVADADDGGALDSCDGVRSSSHSSNSSIRVIGIRARSFAF